MTTIASSPALQQATTPARAAKSDAAAKPAEQKAGLFEMTPGMRTAVGWGIVVGGAAGGVVGGVAALVPSLRPTLLQGIGAVAVGSVAGAVGGAVWSTMFGKGVDLIKGN